MRVTHTNIYDGTRNRLGGLVAEYTRANEEVSSGKRINRLADDPVGISRVVALRSSLSNLDQMTKNVRTANTWLTEAETSLKSVKNAIDDVKVLAIAMNNGTMTTAERANAAVQIQETLGQILDLANAQVNGQYLFSGTKVDTKPYAFDNPTAPTTAVYAGNEVPFSVKTGRNTDIVVGYSGTDVFTSKTLTVDETNRYINFREDNGGGLGPELTATIPPGSYTADQLVTAMGAAMTGVSASGFTYTVNHDSLNGTYTIHHNSVVPGAGVNMLWATGTNASRSIAPDIGFSAADVPTGNDLTSDQGPVEWSVFNTLIDLKNFLSLNDTSGIERSMTRLDTQFGNMSNAISQIGYKGVSLDIKTNVMEELDLSYQNQKKDIEETDIIEAISRLQAKENAYKAALASSSRLMQLNLTDYLK